MKQSGAIAKRSVMENIPKRSEGISDNKIRTTDRPSRSHDPPLRYRSTPNQAPVCSQVKDLSFAFGFAKSLRSPEKFPHIHSPSGRELKKKTDGFYLTLIPLFYWLIYS